MGEHSLPPELERQIFEMAARSRPTSIPRLMRVAWRVKHWLEPLLYHTLIFNMNPIDGFPRCTIETFNRIVRTKPGSFLRDSVRRVVGRHLSFNNISNILTACPGIEHLNITVARELAHLPPPPRGFDALPLKKLHCDLNVFVDFDTPLAVPAFAHLTHLELFDFLDHHGNTEAEVYARWATLGSLPHLTHLALPYFRSRGNKPILRDVLALCKSLCALLVLRAPEPGTPFPEEIAFLQNNDMRVVLLGGYTLWQAGALTGADIWARADKLISQKLSGEVSRGTLYLDLAPSFNP
ncbi:hypothetical protein DFH06DRAFT_1473260 [Mycena polygramma]|nr:hypothetical protein DFH06DRAFT_1473260 [Mycena polygramma]